MLCFVTPHRFSVEAGVVRDLVRSLRLGRPIVPVGTTSVRVLESLYWLGARGLLGLKPDDNEQWR